MVNLRVPMLQWWVCDGTGGRGVLARSKSARAEARGSGSLARELSRRVLGWEQLLSGSCFPAAVGPEILFGPAAGVGFDGVDVFLGDPEHGVLFAMPFPRPNDAFDAEFVTETVSDAAAVSDDDRHVMLQGQQSHRFTVEAFLPKKSTNTPFRPAF